MFFQSNPTILKAGHPILKTVCKPVSNQFMKTSDFQAIIAKMKRVFKSPSLESHTVGLAAPQIGYSVRLLAYCFEDKEVLSKTGIDKPIPLTFIANPELTIKDVSRPSDWRADYESCLSVPHYKGLVRRAANVTVNGINAETHEIVRVEAEGVLARVLQHEIDHLDGILFTDRMEKHSLTHDSH